jgi:hypothetical protein
VIRPLALVALVAVLVAPTARAGEVPEATLILEATVGVPATLPAAAPPRFLLRRDRSVFVGGSEQIYSGLLDNDAVKAIERRVKALRKSDVLAPSVSFGDDTTRRYRLRLLEDGARDVVITGDPATAPPELQALALLVSDLERFDHPSLRPWQPAEYAVSAREGVLVGGCREWLLPLSLDEVLAGPRRLAADEAERWPKGADPASVCRDGRRYVVTLRPLLPGEQP